MTEMYLQFRPPYCGRALNTRRSIRRPAVAEVLAVLARASVVAIDAEWAYESGRESKHRYGLFSYM